MPRSERRRRMNPRRPASADAVGAGVVVVAEVATPRVVVLRRAVERPRRERGTRGKSSTHRLGRDRYASTPKAAPTRSRGTSVKRPQRRAARSSRPVTASSRQSRTRLVWASFLVATAAVSGLFVIGDRGTAPPLASVASREPGGRLQPSSGGIEQGRWTSIVIHHSGLPGGTPESIDREHRSYGYAGLGYHFLIGNGRGLDDGAIHAGPRWNLQQPGAHVAPRAGGATPDADELNRTSIGICLIGNGSREEFTARQMTELVALVRRLQQELEIPASAVHLHSDLAAVESPGPLFPAAAFANAILD